MLELASRVLCEHVAILPESAGILFGGGFPRHESRPGRAAAQRSIFRVQRELERLVEDERRVAIGLCDRGTLDGVAYWPGADADFWAEAGTTRTVELDRYAAVIHLETPLAVEGYDHSNPLRTEEPEVARAVDARIRRVWEAHPNRHVVSSVADFLSKAQSALDIIRSELPACCLAHDVTVPSTRATSGADS